MLFKFFKRKQQPENQLTPNEFEHSNQWNKMWNLWADGKIESPYDELMSYHGEVNNGGHYQFFSNTDNIENSQSVIEKLSGILPEELKINLEKAYTAYINLENDTDIDFSEQEIKKCDNNFFKNEHIITKILKNHSEQFR